MEDENGEKKMEKKEQENSLSSQILFQISLLQLFFFSLIKWDQKE